MQLARQLLPLAIVALLLTTSSPASAVYQCGPDKDDCQCGMNNPYPCCDNGGNCTWWSWDRACCNWKVGLPGWGNANQWAGNAKAHPSYTVLSYPVVNSIAVRVAGTYGHVAWVTAVSGSNVTVSEQNCWGGWGHQSATRDKSFYDGGFIVPNDQCECQPGQTQTQSCGNCGEQTRSCNTSCKWDSWSACGGEGVCTPGQSEEQACGDCGKQSRSCQADCSWSELSSCASDPAFVPSDCDTQELGACAKGSQQCVDGTLQCAQTVQPTTETCNGVDDDCDGITDNGTCWTNGGSHDAGNPSQPSAPTDDPSAEPDPADDAIEGSCACTVDKRTPTGGLSALLALFALALRRRAKRS